MPSDGVLPRFEAVAAVIGPARSADEETRGNPGFFSYRRSTEKPLPIAAKCYQLLLNVRGVSWRKPLQTRGFTFHPLIGTFACLACGDRLDGVPVVGCGDHDRVDVRPVQHGPEVLDPSHIGGKFCHAWNALPQAGEPRIDLVVFGIQVRCINITERDNLRIGMGKEGLEKLAAAVAHADETKTDLVACPEHPGRGQRRSGTGGRGRHRGLREITTVETRGHGSCLSPAPASRRYVMETLDGSRRTWFRPDALIKEWSRAGVNGPMTTGET